MFRDLGDFQTPPALVETVLHSLTAAGQCWSRVLEPTCGCGNFIKGLLHLTPPPCEIQGIEIQDQYIECLQKDALCGDSTYISIKQANIFQMKLQRDLIWNTSGSLLVIGNPPWVTNAEQGSLESTNLPVKSNFKGLNGFDAMTGTSNFDIAEYILLKLIRELGHEKPTIALLCKTSVARNVLQYAFQTDLPLGKASIRKIDSKKFFGAFVDACLFRFDVGVDHACYQAEVYDSLSATTPLSITGVRAGRMVADLVASQKFSFLDGVSPLTWRQGIKHDAASVMELACNAEGMLTNKLGEIVEVEPEYIYPLLKSSDLGGKEKIRQKRAMIVPQQYIGDDTATLEFDAPLLWKYLSHHQEIFAKRKSSIYEKQPSFAIFGIGHYTFAPYKVAISGMYKAFQFRIIGPTNSKPVVFDDTCYFLPCSSLQQAALVFCLFQHPLCIDFLHSLVFWDAKRPITKKLLQRVDLNKLLQHIGRTEIVVHAEKEIQRIEGIEREQYRVWPDDLAELLQEHPKAHRVLTLF
jgi:hypothetical protein